MTDSLVTLGYTDDVRNIGAEIASAHHLRYVKLPSGRRLYMIGTRENDCDEIEELQIFTSAANIGLEGM